MVREFIVTTPEKLALIAANSWKSQYNGTREQRKIDIGKKLLENKTPTPENVANIIGNGSWTETKCDHCEQRNLPVVEVGQPEDYDSRTADICVSCLKLALKAIEAAS